MGVIKLAVAGSERTPLGNESSIGSKLLDSVIACVRHVNNAEFVDDDTMWIVEFPRAVAWNAPTA